MGKGQEQNRRPPNEWEENICSKEDLRQELLVTAQSPKGMFPLQHDELELRGESS